MTAPPTYTKGASLALAYVQHQIAYGISRLERFTESDEYVALDIARRTLEAIPAGVNPVEDADEAVRRWRHLPSRWSEARA